MVCGLHVPWFTVFLTHIRFWKATSNTPAISEEDIHSTSLSGKKHLRGNPLEPQTHEYLRALRNVLLLSFSSGVFRRKGT
jgi:hypothetical protein